MCRNTLVYWHESSHVPGKEPNWSELRWSEPCWSEPCWSEPCWSEPCWSESYNPNRTIGCLIEAMSKPAHGLCGSGERIEIIKYVQGDMNRIDPIDPFWAHDAKLSDCLRTMGGHCSDVVLIYCLV